MSELFGSRESKWTKDGGFGKRVWVTTWETRGTSAPDLGDTYPGDSRLQCVSVSYAPYGASDDGSDPATHCRIEAEYNDEWSKRRPLWAYRASSEAINMGQGRMWGIAGTTIEDEQVFMLPGCEITISWVTSDNPINLLFAAVGKVNDRVWRGFAGESLLCVGVDADEEWFSTTTGTTRWRVSVTLRFRSVSHNLEWRPKRQTRDTDGNKQWDGTGYPEYSSGLDGVSGWDRPMPEKYARTNFSYIFRFK